MSELRSLTEEIAKVVDRASERQLWVKKYPIAKFNAVLETITDEHWQDIRDYFITAIEIGGRNLLEYGARMLQARKLINWKEHTEIFDTIFDCLMKYGHRGTKEKDFWDKMDYYSTTDKMITLLKSLQILNKYTDRFYALIPKGLASLDNKLSRTIMFCASVVPWQDHPERINDMAERTYVILDENPDMPRSHIMAHPIEILWQRIFQALMATDTKCKRVANAISANLAKIFIICADQDWIDADNMEERNLNWEIMKRIMEDYIMRHRDDTELVKHFFPTVRRLKDCEDKIMNRDANNIFKMLGSNIAELMGDDLSIVIDEFVEQAETSKIHQISEAYKGNKAAFRSRVNRVVLALCGNQELWAVGLASLAWDMAKEYPEEFSKEAIKAIVSTLPKQEASPFGLLPLSALAPTRKKELLQYDDNIIACMKNCEGMGMMATEILVHLATLGKEHAVKYLRLIAEMAKQINSKYAINLLCNMKVIGEPYPEELGKYKGFFEDLLNNPSLKDYAQSLLDVIEGRNLQNISKEVEKQKGDIEDLDTRVTETETKVDDLEQDVTTLNQDVSGLKTNVEQHGEKIYELEVAVEETQDKVEEIDKKTLSHAPIWSRDVARLMNQENEYDWRYLATKLGYSNDDIRNWATQPDPCLSLLDEWFATHKTRDATFAVEQALNDMNRTDAAMIVENALKQADDVVEDDEDEVWDPPSIFISYQWAHQPEVKLLHRHLEMAGYKSWMDIGQMGGGDKLFAKIDQGIRAAKVVICCVSEKYAKSPNCNREVNLAVTLGKPMIPLLMEKLSWPPPGSMGPIFGEYIFVRFFARPGETAGDDRYWPTAKFQELLMQLRYTHAPDSSLISDVYKDCWSPPEEIITIKQQEDKTKSQAKTAVDSETGESDDSPDVFISYQWGKQPQIKKLYEVLTNKGYRCWLDIMQMGGGDSLYDKIDKGIRGCKVVISCVTTKYALSANCRREVSLADAIKKPIIPLLLEKSTWPPAGPMSMVFTQLLYIDFCSPDVEIQTHWQCSQIDELYAKLVTYIPDRESDGANGNKPEPNSDLTVLTADTSNKINPQDGGQETKTKESQAPEEEPQDVSSTDKDSEPQSKVDNSKNAVSASPTPQAEANQNENSPQTMTQKENQEKPKSSSTCAIL